MKTFFHAAGNGIVTGLLHVVYFFWTCYNFIVYRPKVVYLDAEYKKALRSPCIIVANHTSHNDGFFLPQVLHRLKLHVLVTAKWYDKKKLNWIFRRFRYIRVDLTEMDNTWMERAVNIIKNGGSVLIFPEGKLEEGDSLEEFHPGFLMLKRHTDAPVIPVVIEGGYRIFHRQTVTVGKEFIFDVHQKGRPSVLLREGAALCREQMERMFSR